LSKNYYEFYTAVKKQSKSVISLTEVQEDPHLNQEKHLSEVTIPDLYIVEMTCSIALCYVTDNSANIKDFVIEGGSKSETKTMHQFEIGSSLCPCHGRCSCCTHATSLIFH
jgi:hypothetical protein